MGDTARLSVSVVAYPPPTFTWYSPTHTGPIKYDIRSNHSFAALTLRNLKVTESGTCTVNVTNIYGTLTRHFLVQVDGKTNQSFLQVLWALTVFVIEGNLNGFTNSTPVA